MRREVWTLGGDVSLESKYDIFYSESEDNIAKVGRYRWPRDRYQAVVSTGGEGDVLLDIGCGNGALLSQFAGTYRTLLGVEFSPVRLEQARRNLKARNFIGYLGSAENMSQITDASVDRIICSDTIEHIPDVYAAIAEMYRVLKPQGELVINTPNIAYIKRRLMLLCGRFPSTSQGNEGLGDDVLFDGGHFHYFTFRSLSLLLERRGFKVTKKMGYGRFGFWHSLAPSITSNGIQILAQKALMS